LRLGVRPHGREDYSGEEIAGGRIHTGHIDQEMARGMHRVLVGKPKGNRLLGNPRRLWEDSIKGNLREIRSCGMDYIRQAQDRDQWRDLINMVMNLRVS
jgi:hypothetical protein